MKEKGNRLLERQKYTSMSTFASHCVYDNTWSDGYVRFRVHAIEPFHRMRAPQCVTFLSKKQWSLHAAQGKRHSKWSKWTRWGHLDGGRFDDIITRITLAYVNALHACIRSYECTWIRAHSQFLTHEYANVCIFNVYIAHVYTRWDSCRDGKNRRRDKRARTKDPISSPISTVKKKRQCPRESLNSADRRRPR